MRPVTLAKALLVVGALAAPAAPALGQRVAPARPLSLVVGRAESPAPAERVDGARLGLSPVPLPDGAIHVAWRRAAGPFVEHAPLVTPEGDIVVFSGRGDFVELAADGSEKRRVAIGNGPLGPGAILADGTIVTMTTSGEAVGVRTGVETAHVRFRTRVGDRGMLALVAPLPLDDGGVVVANSVCTPSPSGEPSSGPAGAPWQSEIAALDTDGRVRTRTTLPLAVVWPLVATRLGVVGVSADGTVFVWAPGSDPLRVGTFGGILDGGAAASSGTTLVAVVDGKSVVSMDLEHGETRVLHSTAGGVVLGPPSIAPGGIWVLEATPSGHRLLSLDGQGGASPFPTAGAPAALEADGGIAPTSTPIHTATLVDTAGRVAFAGPDGHVGVLGPRGTFELGEALCGRGAPPLGATGASSARAARPSAGFAGLTPTAPGSFLVACEGGTLLEVTGER